MDRRGFAVWTVLVGLLVGLVGNILFYGKLIGLSFPLFTLVVAATVLVSHRPVQKTPRWHNLWPLIPLAFFASMIAVHASPSVLMSNMLAVLTLGALLLYYMGVDRRLDERSFLEHLAGIFEAGMMIVLEPLAELTDSWEWLRERRGQRQGPLKAVLRGLLLALPLVLIFAVLLGSADAIFANYLERIWEALRIKNPEDLIGQSILIAGLGWLACGAIAYGVSRRPMPPAKRRESRAAGRPAEDFPGIPFDGGAEDPFRDIPSDGQPEAHTPAESIPVADAPGEEGRSPALKPPLELGVIESGIILGSVDLLFGAFVLIQFAYFFGGRVNVTVEGLTYAEYARRGFFELVAVSVLALGLALALDWVTVRPERRQHTLFRALAVIIVALTMVMLVSAWLRMALYEQAFGFTHLRLYTHLFMLWLGVLFGFFLLSLFRLRQHIFSLGLLVFMIGYLVSLNLINPDYYIAERNIARYHDGHELDLAYLRSLSVDTTPALVAFYEATGDTDPDTHTCTAQMLAWQLAQQDLLHAGEGQSAFSANLSRDRAWALLDGMREELPDFDGSFFWENCASRDYGRE